ncbi:baseplate multidomain protein megatron [Pseudochelatococcus sp. G4_1912]|uniref:baseplate multidomain protein megatron n=1 Tax=Pseudochelatococcus sp. G4_1912 TaxID=3114288 RepID=UPI0039C5E5C4
MATLVLQVAGAAVGGLVGGPIGAIAGRAIGGLAGAVIDSQLFGGGGGTQYREGPRLTDMDGLSSTEGAPVPRVYGRARIGGQLIWATRFEEVVEHEMSRAKRGGKGGVVKGPKTITTTYSYYANLAIGLCEGPIAQVRRIWADGKELKPEIDYRVYKGTEDQLPDHLIIAKEGMQHAPAYRGLAYVVFEHLPLAEFGNRVPQFTFEVIRPANGLGERIRAVEVIPGASEFAYETATVMRMLGPGVSAPENQHQGQRGTDMLASFDALAAVCPNLQRVAIVTSWFGNDLRAGQCTIKPRVEYNNKHTFGGTWSVAGLLRHQVEEVSRIDGNPAYGGTPSDASVLAIIQEAKARGWQVTLYPFVMMDVPAGNTLIDPRTGAVGQPPYPWRGRVTCDPAPGRPGTVDGTSAATVQVASLFGAADGWGLRRLVRHYAGLAVQAGGVDAIVLGSEMIGLTRVRSSSGVYPAVEEFRALAAEVRGIVGGDTYLTYAADWTEYGAHVLNGGQEVRFPLDPLWADPNINVIGIDFYAPLSDWRDGTTHLDASDVASVYDLDYLTRGVTSGEAFDWYYADDAARAAQVRMPIIDNDYGKPWIHRQKDLAGWWSNPHIERMDGLEIGATPWVAYSKHIWLTEIGIPAVDRGTNGPNVFPDPKSSESAYPPFSRGMRDDLIQNRGLRALINAYGSGHTAANPLSPFDGQPMVDASRLYVWTWDARPYPAFPSLTSIWRDGDNWETGHWLTGRLEGLTLEALVAAIVADWGLEAADIKLDGELDGYVVDRPLSARQVLEPLAGSFGFHAVASAGVVRFRGNAGPAVLAVTANEIVPDRDGAGITLRRAQETDLPSEIRLGFTDSYRDYRRSAALSRRLAVGSKRSEGRDLAAVMRPGLAQHLADIGLQAIWVGRETASFTLSPRHAGLEPGDIIALPVGEEMRPFRVSRISDGVARQVEVHAVAPSLERDAVPDLPRPLPSIPQVPGPPAVTVLDLPISVSDPQPLQVMAVFADPWPSAEGIWRSADGASYDLHTIADLRSIVGETITVLGPGPVWRWDVGNSVDVRLRGGLLSSISDAATFAAGNAIAVQGADGRWEVLCAAHAELVGDGVVRLSRLLRGLGGSEPEAARSVPIGAKVVVLDSALVPLTTEVSDIGRPWRYRVGPIASDHAGPMVVEVTAAATTETLKPLMPVHLRARREGSGIRISFIRRTRIGGDNWELSEVPLSEEREAYEIDIFDGAGVKRTLSSTEPFVIYENALEIADFGAAQTSLHVSVSQISATAGRGFEAVATLKVR